MLERHLKFGFDLVLKVYIVWYNIWCYAVRCIVWVKSANVKTGWFFFNIILWGRGGGWLTSAKGEWEISWRIFASTLSITEKTSFFFALIKTILDTEFLTCSVAKGAVGAIWNNRWVGGWVSEFAASHPQILPLTSPEADESGKLRDI